MLLGGIPLAKGHKPIMPQISDAIQKNECGLRRWKNMAKRDTDAGIEQP